MEHVTELLRSTTVCSTVYCADTNELCSYATVQLRYSAYSFFCPVCTRTCILYTRRLKPCSDRLHSCTNTVQVHIRDAIDSFFIECVNKYSYKLILTCACMPNTKYVESECNLANDIHVHVQGKKL